MQKPVGRNALRRERVLLRNVSFKIDFQDFYWGFFQYSFGRILEINNHKMKELADTRMIAGILQICKSNIENRLY